MTAPPQDADNLSRPDPDARLLAGRYRLIRVVGSGGMGVVWEAAHAVTGRRVAVKLMRPPMDTGGRTTLPVEVTGRFLREAQATARVRHPNVVEVLDVGRGDDPGELFIVYELLDGETLRAMLERQKRLTPDEAARILVPVLEGLAAAHRESVLHRDLKPENVMLAREPDARVVPRLIDFGVARIDDPENVHLTRTGAALGTAHYMSPEQARGARDLDVRSDVWSAGVLWFEALTGALPYDGSGYNEVLAKILTGPPPRLMATFPDVPRPLADAVDRALAHDREDRYATVDKFLAALRAALHPERESASPAPARSSRRRVVIAACSVVLALCAAFAFTRSPRAMTSLTPPRPSTPARLEVPPAVPTPVRVALAAPDASALVPVGEAPVAHAPASLVRSPARRLEVTRRAPTARRAEASSATQGAPRTAPAPVNGALVLEP